MKRKRSEKVLTASHAVTEPDSHEREFPPWNPVTRVAFRFCFVYLGLFSLATQITGSMIPNSFFEYRGLGRLFPMREVTFWIAQHFFATVLDAAEPQMGGEPLFFWVQTFWLLVVAILATGIWSVMDRRRENYVVLHKWFRLFIRFGLASQMFEYGMTKVIPTQFPAPPLNTLLTPAGDLTLSGLLWTSIGASPPYEIFTGCIETLGGVLLLVPRTTLLGATISLAALMQVFALNVTYDVGLKLVSFHLIALAVFLMAPDIPRFADFFLRNRSTGASTQPELFSSTRARRIALGAQIVFGLYLVGMYAYINVRFWDVGGGGSPKSPLYGIWNVEELSIDGRSGPPDLNDYDRRWRRVIFDKAAEVSFQRTDDSFATYKAVVDPYGKTLSLAKRDSEKWKATLNIERPSADRLILDGEMDGYKIRTALRLVDFDTFRLLNSSFRWVRPHARPREP